MNHEVGNTNSPNDEYDRWQNAMKKAEFQGNIQTPDSSETENKPASLVEKVLDKIKGVKELIAKRLDLTDDERITEMTDDALVYVAKETIVAADQDSVRTKDENDQVKDAVSTVVVQGAMEEAGVEQSAGKNPILELNKDETRPELEAAIATLQEEDAMLPSGESIAGLATRAIERDKEWSLKRVGEREGSNEGGWYEKTTGERYYVKFYDNPNQGKVEFIANAIYEKLGIKAVKSEIVQIDGREAVVSPAIVDARRTNVDIQKDSEDVQKGFVTDAYLANWDVIGLTHDNILEGEGGLFRIDNGGSMIFRAMGGDKEYSPDSIPELETMLDPAFTAGEVFANISEDEIKKQAQELISILKPEDIRAIVDESGLEGDDRSRVLNGLLGRREFLAKTYGETEPAPRRSISETIKMLKNQEVERAYETPARPRAEVICDRDHIEDQRIDVIDKSDKGKTEFRFKLRSPNELMTMLENALDNEEDKELATLDGTTIGRGEIRFDCLDSSPSLSVCDAYTFEKEGVSVSIANPASRRGFPVSSFDNESKLVRSAIGLVTIEAPAEMDPEKVEEVLEKVLEKDFGIHDALDEVSDEAEREYKLSRYRWQHVISGELTPEQNEQVEKLKREEVFPGYTTFVEKGKHKEYLEEYGEDLRAFHVLSSSSVDTVYRILTHGLMSTTERLSRGINSDGQSSATDIDTGGADSVFTRIANRNQRKAEYRTTLVFKPEIFDRTDWYSFERDSSGSTAEEFFSERLSPDSIFEKTSGSGTDYAFGNEQMFRTGIGANYIESIEVNSAKNRDYYIAGLRSMGLEEFNGRPIESLIVSREEDFETYSEQEIAQARIQAITSGETAYSSVQELFDLAGANGSDFTSSLKSMVDSIVSRGDKEQLARDMSSFIIETLSLDELKYATGELHDDSLADEIEIFQYLQQTLGLDYNAIYKEKLLLQESA